MHARERNWIDVRRAAEDGGVAVLPLGSMEAHGPHLPLGTDSILIEAIIEAAADSAGEHRIVVFPTVEYNVVEWARPFASTGVQPLTLIAELRDMVGELRMVGFTKIAVVHGHANNPAGQVAVWQLRQEGTHALFVDCCPYFMAAERAAEIAGETVAHGGVIETSLMLAVRAELVDMARAVDGPDDLWGPDFPFASLRGRPGLFAVPSVMSLPDGVEGKATRATAEIGRKLLALYTSVLAEMLGDLAAGEVPPEFLEPGRVPLPEGPKAT
jgi:creatinine amidohydrolase